jgi:hypothetical protein
MSIDLGKLPSAAAAYTVLRVLRGASLNGVEPARIGAFWFELAQGIDRLPSSMDEGARTQWACAELARRGYDEAHIAATVAQLLRRGNAPPVDPGAALIPAVPSGTYLEVEECAPPAWLDRYSAYARAVAPMTPRLFHEGAALWLLSVVVARRLVVHMSFGDVFPNLFILWMAPTTLYHKTTALDLARSLARRHFPQLLTPQDVTYEALLSDLAGLPPTNLEKLPEDRQARWQAGRAHAAQRGWCLDEMSGLLSSAGRDYNAGLVESLLRLYDCDENYSRLTRGQGLIEISHAYLSFLGASTPVALAPHLEAARLWDIGWWPRCAILTPEAVPRYALGEGSPVAPADVSSPLLKLHSKLPAGAPGRAPVVLDVGISPAAGAAHATLSRVLGHELLLSGVDDERLYGTYGRLPTAALKVATLLAAVDWVAEAAPAPVISRSHYARAARIIEDWRQSAHRALSLIRTSASSALQQQILRLVAGAEPQGITARDIGRGMRHVEAKVISATLRALRDIGEVYEFEPAMPTGGRPTVRYRGVPEGVEG